MIPLTRGDALRYASRLPLAFIFRALGAEIPVTTFGSKAYRTAPFLHVRHAPVLSASHHTQLIQ